MPLSPLCLITLILLNVPPAHAAHPTLDQLISSADVEVRADAFEHLLERLTVGRWDEETFRAFMATASETDHSLQMQRDLLIERVPVAAVSDLAAELQNGSPESRAFALHSLGVLGIPSSVEIPILLDLLLDQADPIASAAAFALPEIDHDGSAIPRVISILDDDSVAHRLQAARALDRYGARVSPFAAHLIEQLHEPDQNVRYWIVICLGNIKTMDDRVFHTFLRLIESDGSSFVRTRIAREFWEYAHDGHSLSADAVQVLTSILANDADAELQRESAKALVAAYTATPSQNVADALRRCSETAPNGVRRVCRQARIE